MTTKHSSPLVLQGQADAIANIIKRAERGDKLPTNMRAIAGRVQAARESKNSLKVAVLMDDKNIILEMPWDVVAESSEAGLAQFVLKAMMETRDDH